MESRPICFFYNCKSCDDVFYLFNEYTLNRCKDILAVRKYCKIKYNDVIVPEEVDTIHGYHRLCYKLFTSVSHNYVKRYLWKQKRLMALNSNPNDEAPRPSQIDSIQPAETFRRQLRERPGNNVPPLDWQVQQSNGQEGHPVLKLKLIKTSPLLETQYSILADEEAHVEPQYSIMAAEEAPVSPINENVCIFCDQVVLKKIKLILPLLSTNDEKSIQAIYRYANAVNDEILLAKLIKLSPGDEIFYHNECKAKYYTKTRPVNNQPSVWHEMRVINNLAFKRLTEFIEENIMEKGTPYPLKILSDLYNDVIKQEMHEKNLKSAVTVYAPAFVLKKIKNFYGKNIKVIDKNNQKLVASTKQR